MQVELLAVPMGPVFWSCSVEFLALLFALMLRIIQEFLGVSR